MNKLIRQFGEIRKSENDNRTVEFVFSTAAKDRHRTVLNQDAWELDNFNRNGIAGYMHDVYGDGLLAKPDPDDVIGKARAWVDGDSLRGEITFEPADLNEKADKVYRKIQFGSLNAVSVGFVEKGAGRMGDEEGEDKEAYYFAGQELLEISVVNIPSNPEALKSRDFKPWNETQTDLTKQVINTNKMEKEEKKDLAPETSKVDVNVKVDASELNEAVTKLADTVEKLNQPKPEDIPGAPAPTVSEHDKKDLDKYSIHSAILKQAEAKQGIGKFDGIELEMHQEAVKEARDAGRAVSGIGVPAFMLHSRADLQATTDAVGGYTVGTDTTGFIPTLQNTMATMRAGATMLSGLVGDVSIPRQATDSTATWRSEGGVATESDPTFEAVTMTPHRLTSYTIYSMQLLRQGTPDVTKIVNDTLYYSIANALETAAFEGDGTSNVPTGILNATNVNDAEHGSNTTVASWANIVNMESMVAVDNALSAKMAYVMKATAAAKLKTTEVASSTGRFIWNYDPLTGGTVNGYPALVTNVFTDDTVIFGDFSQLMYGQWGGLDLLVNPYSLDTYAQIRVVIAGYFDMALRHGQSFARIDDLEV